MDCLQGNCNVSGNDRMVSCWLCLGSYHIKCCGLRARDADALADLGKSLHWTCSRCKNIKIDFYKFFKNYKDVFDQLNKEFLSAQSKLSTFGELFTKFQMLDQFVDTDKSTSTNKKTLSISLPTPVLPNSSLAIPPNSAVVNDVFVFPSTSSNETSSQTCNSSSITIENNFSNAKSPLIPPLTQTSENLNSDDQPRIKPLKAIPPKKFIFVSRLASGTSPEDVDYYLKSKTNHNADILIHKFKFSQPRSISSFKLTVPAELFENIMDPGFWPVNTLVREFTYNDRRKPIGVLPQREGYVSKN